MASIRSVLAIDPGKNGGVAIVNRSGKVKVKRCPSDNDPFKMANIIKKMTRRYKHIQIIIENVWAFPTDSAMTSFKFGTNFGIWLGILGTMGLPYRKVTPQTWQKVYQPLSKEKKERKNQLKTIAKDFYEKATLNTSDAILMAIWGIKNV